MTFDKRLTALMAVTIASAVVILLFVSYQAAARIVGYRDAVNVTVARTELMWQAFGQREVQRVLAMQQQAQAQAPASQQPSPAAQASPTPKGK